MGMNRGTSDYYCPRCQGHLRTVGNRMSDWFCRGCGTAVVRLEADHYLYWTPGAGLSRPCSLEDLVRRT